MRFFVIAALENVQSQNQYFFQRQYQKSCPPCVIFFLFYFICIVLTHSQPRI